jgi:hypothetical protein
MTIVDHLRPLLRLRALQLAALTILLATVGVMALQLKYFVTDSDIWWHLKVGDWIVSHLAVPHTGILSRTAANRPWVAYSWGYEVLLSRAYDWFGLVGIGVYGTLLTLGVAYFIYWMLRRLSGEFWIAWILTWPVCWSFVFNGTPRPFFFSIALFAVTLTLLVEANRSGRVEALYWLPLVFWVWANLHIQFIYGLFLVGLFVGVNLVERVAESLGVFPKFLLPPSLPTARLVIVSVACFVATLLGPNFYHPYVVVLDYSRAKFTYSIIIELQPLSFRGYSHFLELFIAVSGFFAVGWQARERSTTADGMKLDLFKLALLAVGSVVAFRTMRDAWFICLPAAACIADAFRELAQRQREEDLLAKSPSETWLENLGIGAVVAIMLALVANSVDFNQRGLDRAISAGYPVNAINFLRRNPVPGPLYNNLNWGGFLMWYMPDYPVAIDGRNDLYGDDLDKIFYGSQSAEESYKTDPYLNEAGVVLLDSTLPLAKVLTIDPRFRLAFHDEVATAFVRNDLPPSNSNSP